MGTVRDYPIDLTEEQWQKIAPLLPKPKKREGDPRRSPCKQWAIVNVILYGEQNQLPVAHGAQGIRALEYPNKETL